MLFGDATLAEEEQVYKDLCCEFRKKSLLFILEEQGLRSFEGNTEFGSGSTSSPSPPAAAEPPPPPPPPAARARGEGAGAGAGAGVAMLPADQLAQQTASFEAGRPQQQQQQQYLQHDQLDPEQVHKDPCS